MSYPQIVTLYDMLTVLHVNWYNNFVVISVIMEECWWMQWSSFDMTMANTFVILSGFHGNADNNNKRHNHKLVDHEPSISYIYIMRRTVFVCKHCYCKYHGVLISLTSSVQWCSKFSFTMSRQVILLYIWHFEIL